MRRTLELLFTLVLLAAGTAHSSPVRFSIELKADRSAPEPVQGLLKLASQAGRGEARTLELPFEAPGEREIEVPPGSWEARFEAKGFWSETLTIPEQSAGARFRILRR